MINVAILDGRLIVRAGLELFLGEDPDLRFVGQADNIAGVAGLVRDEVVQVLVCELGSATDVLKALQKQLHGVGVLAYSDEPPIDLLSAAMHMSANFSLTTLARRKMQASCHVLRGLTIQISKSIAIDERMSAIRDAWLRNAGTEG